MLENIMKINKELLNFFNSFSNNELIWENIWILADAPIFFLPIFLLWAWLFYSFTNKSNSEKSEKKSDLLFIFYWIIFTILISLLIQQFVHLDRPELHLISSWKMLLEHLPDASFPSDHATVSFAFLTWLFLANYRKIWIVYLPFVIIMNLSRIIAWVHWPFDILAWSLVWIFWMIFIFKFWKKSKILIKINKIILKIMWFIKL
jgi:undecaprenyl-diphosphatase